MELNSWTIYWITRFDSIHLISNPVCVIGLIAIIVGVFAHIAMTSSSDKDIQQCVPIIKKHLFWVVPTTLLFCAIEMFVPTTKEMAAIVIIPKVLNNQLTDDMKDIHELARQYLQSKVNSESDTKRR